MQTIHEQKPDDADDHGSSSYSETEIIQDFDLQMKKLNIDDSYSEEEEEDFDEEEFSFMYEGTITNPSSVGGADDGLTTNDEITPVFPLFDRNLFFSDEDLMKLPVKKVFVEAEHVTSVTPGSDDIAGPCCEWSAGKAGNASSEACKKSNSTGFSKIWRLKEFVGRSNSDGKDAFVILNKAHAPPPPKAGPKSGRGKTAAAAAHEAYFKSKVKVDGKRRSYLPYRPEFMGFFTNANVGFTKNVHPY